EEIDQLRINKSSQEKIELLKLQDVITRYTDTINYVIDLKEDTKQVPTIAEIIKKNKLEKKVICQSRKSEAVEKLKKALPKTKNILHVVSEEELNQAVTNKNVDTIGLNKSLMTEKNVQLVHQNKKQISIWTLNTTDEIKKAINLNVDSYFTDYTGKAIMLEKEAWKNNNSDK
ncbi:MAG: glycerophosphodiester phosphodiesterase, partial [Culicoidibacterales bacterium]